MSERTPSASKSDRAGLRAAAPYVELAVMAVLFSLVYFALDASLLFNSDLIQVFLMLQDGLGGDGALRHWLFSPALYIFPDWLIAAPLVLAGIPGNWLPIVFAGVQMTLVGLACGWLVSTCLPVSIRSATRGVASLLAMLIGIAFLLGTKTTAWYAFSALASPYIHVGAVLATFWAGALLFRFFQDKRLSGLGWIAAISVLASLSDFSFLPWFTIPAATTSVIAWFCHRNHTFLHACAVIVGSAAAAVVLERMLRDGGGVGNYTPVEPWRSASDMAADFGRHLMSGDLIVLLVCASTFCLLVRCVLLTYRALRYRDLGWTAHLELFLGGMCACAIAAPIGTGFYTMEAHWRYVLVVFLAAPLWLYLIAATWALRRPHLARRLRSMPFVAAAAVVLLVPRAAEALSGFTARTPLTACLMERDLTDGISDYWMAKPTILRTDRQIHLAQVDETGDPYFWNYNVDWFSRRADGAGDFRPRFIILDRLDPERIALRYGRPDNVIDCGGHAVWVYPAAMAWDMSRADFGGADLSRSQGAETGSAAAVDAASGVKGTFTYGPYADLVEGDYVLTLTYTADAAGNSWDLVHSAASRVTTGGDLPSTGGAVGTLNVELEVDPYLTGVELRTIYGGRGRLTVQAIAIRRQAPLRAEGSTGR